ncbi:MAG: hypothetical protein KAT11_00115 [Phycisphaerae bacterium]|nr:hypothetical protein [Phycisphaerae bacterium]
MSESDTKLIDRHIKWLKHFDDNHARQWKHLLKDDREAAMCEATYWDVLQDCGVEVKPNRDLEHGHPSPDFLCLKNGEKFYIEVTCMHIERVTKVTSLSDRTTGAGFYGLLNAAIFDEVRQKTPQCANLDAPALVAVGTFHYQASCLCIEKLKVEMILTGDQQISRCYDLQVGQTVGDTFLSTELKSAAFLKPSATSWLEEARLPVSAILVGGFGCKPPNIYGLLHPNPLRPFNRDLLGRIEFCRVRTDDASGRLATEWL